jgi:D-aspartate ligase
LSRLDLRGVAKVDFKRGPDGRLHVLEVNPRFTLWVHVGALAGVNLPQLVYADLTGRPRPAAKPARAGVTWRRASDVKAARALGIGRAQWLAAALRSDATAGFAWNDPLPLVRSSPWKVLRWWRRRR